MGAISYEVDVRSVTEDLGASLHLDADVELPVLVLGSEEFPPVGPGRLDVTVTNTGAGLVASGAVDARVRAQCSRCLRDFVLDLSGEVEGFYVAPGAEDELPEEQEYAFIREGAIDMMDAVLSALTLELPLAPLHVPDCAGICPTCGADLNDAACLCPPPAVDSPFSALRALFPEDADAP